MPSTSTQISESTKVLALIQARIGSTRLPGKLMLDLAGRPVLAHVIERMRHCRRISEFVVATTINPNDLPIVRMCAESGVRVYCGHEDDPLERYYQAMRLYGADHVIRVKGDCPAIDPEIVDQVIRLHLETGADYTTNTLQRTYPVGQDVEILTRNALEKVWRNAGLQSEREHITLYVPKHPETFHIRHLKQANDLSAKRWTMDYPEDYQLLKSIFERLYPTDPVFGMQAVLEFLAEHPELETLNAHVRADAGVRISLSNDRPVECPS